MKYKLITNYYNLLRNKWLFLCLLDKTYAGTILYLL